MHSLSLQVSTLWLDRRLLTRTVRPCARKFTIVSFKVRRENARINACRGLDALDISKGRLVDKLIIH